MNRNGYTGRLFEEEILGRCRGEWNGEAFWTFQSSIRFAAKNQPRGWDPTDPPLRSANDLHASVALALGLDNWEELRLFSAIGTPADLFYGTDGFFVFRGKVVTLDVTINPHKEDWKADVVVHERELHDRSGLARLAETIAEFLGGGSTCYV